MRVSIITPSYNQGCFIERTILSVLGQTYDNLEYILYDALSQDSTPSVLERYQDKIDVLVSEPDRGQSDALNKGFRRATGDILAYLNADDCYASPTVISEVVKIFSENPDVSVIYGRRQIINDLGYFFTETPFRPFNLDLIYLADYIPQECTFWRRSIFEKCGSNIDETFSFAMDYELWLRFLKHDAKFLSVDSVFGFFRWYSDQKSQSQWLTHGLPEIERLHLQYLGRSIPETEMLGYYNEHMYQVSPQRDKDLFDFYHQVWEMTMWHKRNKLSLRPLDRWPSKTIS